LENFRGNFFELFLREAFFIILEDGEEGNTGKGEEGNTGHSMP
jgi:hypothetical protein